MIDPIKSLMVDVQEYWDSMPVGSKITARHIYNHVVQTKEKNPDAHRLIAIGTFLNMQVKYNTAKNISGGVGKVDAMYEKISVEASRPKNKRFCDVINGSFELEEKIIPSEFSLRYKSMHPKDPITKNYISKLLFALERHKCLIKLERGVYAKIRDIAEHEMTTVTRFIKLKKKELTVPIKVLPVNLPQIDGYATVNSQTLETYIKEIKDLRLIIKGLQRELAEKDRFIQGLPRFDLPSLDTEEYADLKKKFGII